MDAGALIDQVFKADSEIWAVTGEHLENDHQKNLHEGVNKAVDSDTLNEVYGCYALSVHSEQKRTSL